MTAADMTAAEVTAQPLAPSRGAFVLEALAHTAAVELPELAYLASDGILDLPVEHGRIVKIRLELPPKQFLHLQSIGITADDVEDITEVATVRVSSWYGTYEERYDPARLFDFDSPSGTVVHTKADEPAWLEVRFSWPVRVTRLRLRNVPIATARRARGLTVSVTTAWRRTHVLLDGCKTLSSLRRLLNHAAALPGLSPQAQAVLPVLELTISGDYPRAREEFDALEILDDDDRRAFRAAVNTELLSSRSLEWTVHGPQRSFRFWSAEEQADYVRDTVDVTEALHSLTPYVSFGFGAVLAVVRDKALIPHDDDLDIIVGFEPEQAATLVDALRLVDKHLTPLGFRVSGNFSAHRHVGWPGKEYVDVFVGIFEGDAISWYPGTRGALCRSVMYPTLEGSLLGVPCPLPAEPETYLERLYGPGWRSPDPCFKHVWDKSAYADISGRAGPAAPQPGPATDVSPT